MFFAYKKFGELVGEYFKKVIFLFQINFSID